MHALFPKLDQRLLFLLLVLPLLALGAWFLRHPQEPSATLVYPQQMMKHRVILIPLDGRPPCRQFVIDAGRISGIEVLTPPHEYQDYYSQPGDTRAMAAWLQQSLEEQPADAIILSVDQLLYGGLLAAREHPATEAQVETLLQFLESLHQAHPEIPIYAFSILPRLTPQDTIDGYEERRDIMAYSRLAGRKAAGLAIDEGKLQALHDKIPPSSLERYLSHFRENAVLNEKLIDLTRQGILTRLVLGQDDGEEYGIPNIEKYALQEYITNSGLSEREVFLTHGADEIALTLLAAWQNAQAGIKPRIFLQYNTPAASKQVMPYMAVSTGVCAEEKVLLLGGTLSRTPEDADFTLLISTNDAERDTMDSRRQTVQMLADAQAAHQPIGLVDLSKHFTAAETVLPQLIASDFPLNQLLAYAGWNTTSNAIGTALAEACLYQAAQKEVGSTEEALSRAGSQITFLQNRILEDYFYLKEDIDLINGSLKKAGYLNTADLDLEHNYRWANLMLQSLMMRQVQAYSHTPALQAPFPVATPEGIRFLRIKELKADMSFPWPRTFEIYLETTPLLEILP
ncbi:MAG: DUF4127 family protein [Selenomonadaceae bacterium]|nr:DUF4127 family protein [Selenomonadaceae bacterium]